LIETIAAARCRNWGHELGVPSSDGDTTSDIYTHVVPAQYREVADALETWLGGEVDDAQSDEDNGR
jgi:hypothetical protein